MGVAHRVAAGISAHCNSAVQRGAAAGCCMDSRARLGQCLVATVPTGGDEDVPAWRDNQLVVWPCSRDPGAF